jgi:group I intron endonuclease
VIVYLVTNAVNGKRYVGKTKRDLEKRWREHVTHSHGGSDEMALYRALQKHGAESFELSVLEECADEDALDEAERKWIRELGTFRREYNMTEGGDGLKGYRHTEATKRKMSESHRGKTLSPETIEKIRKTNTGQKRSDEAREKMRQAAIGRGHSEEAREKISEALRKRERDTKKVVQLRDGVPLAIFFSAKDAAEHVWGSHCHIREVCLGTTNRRSHRGFEWAYLREEP